MYVKRNEPPALRKNSRRRLKEIKRIESSRSQGSVGLPSRGQTDVVVAVVVPVVVDVQPVRIEVADVDPVAVRVDMLPASVRVTGTRGLQPVRAYILSFLNFIREQLLIQKRLHKKRVRSSISDP